MIKMTNKEAFDTLIDMATALQIIPESKQGQAFQKALYSLNEISCAVDELEKIKEEIKQMPNESWHDCYTVDREKLLNKIDKRISELKGDKK